MIRTGDGLVRFIGQNDSKTQKQIDQSIEAHGVERIFPVPCKKCLGCRRALIASWTLRCIHEAKMHEHSSFVTLTYDSGHLPFGGGLCHKHFQLFIKSLRERFKRRYGVTGIRFFMCGEYGDQGNRPHYHAILFGVKFSDAQPVSKSNGNPLYESDELSSLWGRGFASVADATPATMNYTAAYSSKKLVYEADYLVKQHLGDRPDDAEFQVFSDWLQARSDFLDQHDRRRELIDMRTGEIAQPGAPYLRMSLKPGIGAEWAKRFHTDALKGYVTNEGARIAVPKYYQRVIDCLSDEVRQAHRVARDKRIEVIDALEPPTEADLKRLARFNDEMYLRARLEKRDKL